MSVGKQEAVTEEGPLPDSDETKKVSPIEGTDSGHESNSNTPGSERAQTPQDKSDTGPTDVAFRLKLVSPGGDPFELQVNTGEMVQEIHQVLLDRESTCHRTCFSLQLDGKRMDNFTELRNVEGLTDGATLHVVEEPYTIREARIHVRHIRELVRGGSNDTTYEAASGIEGQSLSYLPTINLLEKKSDGGKPINLPPEYILPGSKDRPLLPLLAPLQKSQAAVQNIALSPFNPPVGPRKLKGDILYLVIDTVEGRRVFVTCCTKGFYVNASTEEQFKPTPSNQNKTVYHSLVDLLNVVSTGFKKSFPNIIRKRFEKHVLDRLPTPYPVHTWIAPAVELSPDTLRAEDSTQPHRVGFEDHLPGQIRDWNEELQTTHEMEKNNLTERLIRDRSVYKIHGDFVSAAVKGAMAVIDGNVMSINPADEPKTHMFIWNNIFLSLGFDVKDHYKELGGDAAAHVATTADLQGVSIYSTIDDPKLCTLGMAIIDYKGYRVTAQSIIPGILDREQEQSVVYGSIDFGKTVVTNEKYVELLEKSAEELKILPHEVTSTDKEGSETTVKLYTSYETKGIIGNDGRSYILDLMRTMPPDVHFIEAANVSPRAMELGFPRPFPHKLAALRPELIEAFVDFRYLTFIRVTAYHLQQARLQDAQDKVKKIDGKEKNEDAKEDELPDADDAHKIVEEALPTKEEAEANKKNQEIIAKAAATVGSLSDKTFDIRFNPDCYSTTVKHAPTEDLEKQRKLLVEAADFLLVQQLPSFVQDCIEHQLTPIDGEGLSELMHNKGINVRYLGETLKLVENSTSYVKPLVAGELVARCAKHVMRKIFQDVPVEQLAAANAHLLNAFLGQTTSTKEEKKSGKGGKKGRRSGSKWAEINTKSLWADISEESQSYFGYPLVLSSVDELCEKFAVQKVPLFRRICKVLGIQMLLKDYKFDRAQPFIEDDVQNMYPVFKHRQPWARDAKHLYLRAQAETSQGRLRDAYECVVEAVNLMSSVYGAMHPELAQALRLLARLSYILGDPQDALAQQHKAALMSERCNGVDHALTIVEYINLAHFAFANLYVSGALRLLYRARYLLLVVHGENHPLMCQIDGNIGVILYAVQEYDLAVKFLSAAESAATVAGEPKRLKSALLNHMLARAQAARGDFRAALASEKETYMIYSNLFGNDHERTKESGECLKHLTQQAVIFQKRMNEAAKGNNIHTLLPVQASSPSLPSILEVMNAINGIIIIQVPASQTAAQPAGDEKTLTETEVAKPIEDASAKAAIEQETLD